MNRSQKIELLKNIKNGTKSITEMQIPLSRVYFVEGDIYTDKDTGIEYTHETLPASQIKHLVRFTDCSIKSI